jgi:hypothetical protein
MPDIRLRNQVCPLCPLHIHTILLKQHTDPQPFDLTFHPTEPVLFASLLTGEVKAYAYSDETGEAGTSWTVRPSRKTARAVDVDRAGKSVWVGGKSGGVL